MIYIISMDIGKKGGEKEMAEKIKIVDANDNGRLIVKEYDSKKEAEQDGWDFEKLLGFEGGTRFETSRAYNVLSI